MSDLRELLRRGDPAIWLAGTGLGISMLMIGGMIALILWNGLGFFWPKTIVQLTLKDNSVVMGEVVAREAIPAPGTPEHLKRNRIQLKLGNRDLTGADFRWIDEADITARQEPLDAVYVERREYGPFIGTPVKLVDGDREVATGSEAVLGALPAYVGKARAAIGPRSARSSGARSAPSTTGSNRCACDGRSLDLEATRQPGRRSDGSARRHWNRN